MMKKNLLRVFCLVLVLTMVLGVIPAMAANDVTVYVSVSDQGAPAVTKDGKPAVLLAVKVPAGSTVETAIIAAHAAYCPDGAAGWEMGESDWGPAMVKIWGKYDGVGAWYQNGTMPMDNVKNMTVSDSDYIDLVLYGPDWSDSYATFTIGGEKKDCFLAFMSDAVFENPGDTFIQGMYSAVVPLDGSGVCRTDDVEDFW